jgi:small subunit ribosomal protein S7
VSRRKRVHVKKYTTDPKFGDVTVGRFINYLMLEGKKSTAEKLFYDSVDIIGEKSGQDGLTVFKKALMNIKPTLEVKSRRIGGANYQIPMEVAPHRKTTLAIRWIIGAIRAKKGKDTIQKITEEILSAYRNEGSAIKKKEDVHRMAEANRAFAHFRY